MEQLIRIQNSDAYPPPPPPPLTDGYTPLPPLTDGYTPPQQQYSE
jgi:hypothetical protein